MVTIKSTDMRFLDALFEMGAGMSSTFPTAPWGFFSGRAQHRYRSRDVFEGRKSKAKRLRFLLQNADRPTACRVLEALWKYRQERRAETRTDETVVNAEGRLLSLVDSIRSSSLVAGVPSNPFAAAIIEDPHVAYDDLRTRLYGIRDLQPHARGYASEGFLKDLYNSSRL